MYQVIKKSVCFVAGFVRFLRWRKASKMWAAKGRKEGTEVQPGVQWGMVVAPTPRRARFPIAPPMILRMAHWPELGN